MIVFRYNHKHIDYQEYIRRKKIFFLGKKPNNETLEITLLFWIISQELTNQLIRIKSII